LTNHQAIREDATTHRSNPVLSGLATTVNITATQALCGAASIFDGSNTAGLLASGVAEISNITQNDGNHQQGLGKVIYQISQDTGLVELALTSILLPVRSTTNAELDSVDTQDVLLEDEGDIETLKSNTFNKVMSWNDGAKKLVGKHGAVPQVQKEGWVTENTSDKPEPLPNEISGPSIEPQSIQPFKNNPLKGMVPIESTKTSCDLPTSSLLALSGGQQHLNPGYGSKARNTSYAEAVTRTPNEVTDTVRVSSLLRKRLGKRGQPSYFDITSELHYPR